MTNEQNGPSTAVQPDLDWSQVRETVRMLFLSVAQIEIAFSESDDSIEHLSRAFTSMMDYQNVITRAVEDLPDTKDTKTIRDTIRHNAKMASQEMQEAIIAFQFYDKLTQRLSHVSSSIESLSDLVSDSSKIYNPNEWGKLQNKIKSRYSMQEEHDMFDSVMQGGDIRQAVNKFNQSLKKNIQPEVEFF